MAISMLLKLLPFNMMPLNKKIKEKKKKIHFQHFLPLMHPLYSVEEHARRANCHLQDVKTLLPN